LIAKGEFKMKQKFAALTACLALGLVLAGTRVAIRSAFAADNNSHRQIQPTEVKVDNFTFNPAAINVPVNTTVSWINKDDIPHVVAGNDGSFKSQALDTDDKYSYTFTKAGTNSYYCPIHPKMVGKVVVH
jgi:plastocyanin